MAGLMTFGKGDLIAFPKLFHNNPALGTEFSYTHPSLDWFYSKHGFAYPKGTHGIPLQIILDGQLIIPDSESTLALDSYRYFHIDRHGNLWKVGITNPSPKGGPGEKFYYIRNYVHRHDSSWWVDADKDEHRKMIGFLYTDPTREEIDDYVRKHAINYEMEWLSIKDITAKINELFPVAEKEKEKTDVDDVPMIAMVG